ncbi:uncharacterized protein G2W53_039748 [Senna tora]|uniref:Uncharacterized protein n=1 Tax=Senna tora TaxID=362788 RepID=A0A834STV5_9FABA|nr:uncharacterized protein G2W53_039748 [Senna tora]
MTKTDGEDGTHNTIFSVDDVRVFVPSVSSQQRFGGWGRRMGFGAPKRERQSVLALQ